MSILKRKFMGEKKELSKYDIIKITIFVILLFSIPSLKYLFPNSILVQKYWKLCSLVVCVACDSSIDS